MASAGHAHAHNSQPMHFSSPSGWRLSTCRPWNRGAVGRFSSGYCSVVTFLNIVEKVTPKPLMESNTRTLVPVVRGGGQGTTGDRARRLLAGQRRHREPAGERVVRHRLLMALRPPLTRPEHHD